MPRERPKTEAKVYALRAVIRGRSGASSPGKTAAQYLPGAYVRRFTFLTNLAACVDAWIRLLGQWFTSQFAAVIPSSTTDDIIILHYERN